MKIFSVYLNKDLNLEKSKFVSNAFSFKAFSLTYLWALFNKLWLFALILISFDLVNVYAFLSDWIHLKKFILAKILVMLYSGFSANLWKQVKHSKEKFQETIIAEDEIAAQKILFENFIFSDNFKNK